MKRTIFTFLILATAIWAKGNDTIPTFKEGNELYRKGLYEKAITVYEKILSTGYDAPEVYYNLGNACFRAHQIPRAILYYEKAKRLKPNDEEINFNLDLARSRIVDKINVLPEFFLFAWARDFFHLLSPSGWALWSVILFLLGLAGAAAYLFSSGRTVRKISFWLGLVFLFVSLSFFLISQQEKHRITSHNDAIIMSPTVTLKSSPDETGTELFVLHEGTKVKIDDKAGDWLEVQISDGNKGWLKESDLERI